MKQDTENSSRIQKLDFDEIGTLVVIFSERIFLVEVCDKGLSLTEERAADLQKEKSFFILRDNWTQKVSLVFSHNFQFKIIIFCVKKKLSCVISF